MKELWVKGVCQGRAEDDGTPISPYMKAIAAYEPLLPRGATCLFLGGGAFILPSLFHKLGHTVTTVERRPSVAKKFGDWARTWVGDARTFLKVVTIPRYNFILLDCYDGDKKPEGLYGKKYLEKMCDLLTTNGTLCVNFIPKDDKELSHFNAILCDMFKSVDTCDWEKDGKVVQIVYFCTDKATNLV